MGHVYLLHFDKPYKHARHYLGYTENSVEKRVARHRSGDGARLMAVIRAKGIGFEVARVWDNVDKHFERKLKNKKCSPLLCPICRAIK